MCAYYRLRRGLNIPLKGEAHLYMAPIEPSALYAIKPADFPNVTPQLLVKENDRVSAGSPLFADKHHPEVLFTAPVSGTVTELVRGEKRKLLEIRIDPDWENEALSFPVGAPEELTPQAIRDLLLQSGCWAYLRQRPYGIIPAPDSQPKDVFISCFDSAPLAPQYDFAYAEKADALAMGLRVMERLCAPDHIHLGVSDQTSEHSVFRQLKANVHTFKGPHPAGNVGVQIHHVCPVGKGQTVWTLDPAGLSIIGSLFLTGTYDSVKPVAITGSSVQSPSYVWCHSGIQFTAFKPFLPTLVDNVRCISGNPLTGDNVGPNGFLGFYHQQVTFLPEGNVPELFGWAKPFRFRKFSASRTYLTYLAPLLGKSAQFRLTTNLNGGVRAFVMTGEYAKVLPMAILPVYLLKAILAGDIDKMEALGIYEVVPEDFALCEFICPSKIEIQDIIRQGIQLMIKEMA